MTDTADTADLISPRAAYAIASQWGSYMTSGDPGAVFYSFKSGDATPTGPAHRAQLIAYTETCLSEADNDADKADLADLLAFFKAFPDTGEETREAYAAESAAILAEAGDFARAYAEAAVFTGAVYPDGHPDAGHDRRYDLSAADIAPDTLRKMVTDCTRFTEANADLLAQAYARDGYGNEQWSAQAQAGHDFWLTRNGAGAGFWDRDALRDGGLGDTLSGQARNYGSYELYTDGDGAIRGC